MKKRILAMMLFTTLLIGTVLTGCGNKSDGNDSEGKGEEGGADTIRWITMSSGEEGKETKSERMMEEFEKETGIKVEAEYYSFSDLFDVIETKSVAKSSDYDVMLIDVTYVSKYAANEYIEPLDSYFTDEEKAEFDNASYTAGVWEDKMFASPRNTSTQLLFYNKTLLDEAGIEAPETTPDNRITYEEVAKLGKEALEKLDPDGSRGLIGFDFQQASRVYQMNMLPNSMGGKNINDDGLSLDGVINTEPWENAMTWYQGLVNDGVASKGYSTEEVEAQFQSGNMVFMIGGTWTPSNMAVEDEVGCTYAPCFEGYEDEVATSTGSWYVGVSSNSENKDSAAKFVKFLTLGSGNDLWLEMNEDVPSRIAKQQEIINDAEASEMLKMAAYEAENTAFPRASTPLFGEYSSILDQMWEDVRNGADVNESIDGAIKQFDAATESYK